MVEHAEHADGHRKDDGGVVLRRDAVERLKISQLEKKNEAY